jgi:hypothetical protein
VKNRLLVLLLLASSSVASACIFATPMTRRNLLPMPAQKEWARDLARKKFAARVKSLGQSLGRWFGGKDPVPAGPVVVDEKTALANFKTEIETAGTWIEEKQKSMPGDPAAMVGEVIGKLKAVKTAGLPADLKGAWADMNAALGELGEVFKGMPKMDALKPEEMRKVMEDLMPKLMAIQAKVEPVAAKLQEIGMKYGLDMKKVAPGGK